ncbi:MAG: ECF transporter S component [Bacillota bacterium]|nr:ECF transporter S component [Bacillota bacterium]
MSENISSQSLKTKNLIRSSLLLALAIVLQLIGSKVPQINQLLVGSSVNAILILSAYLCGISWSISIGVLTPILAWLIGQLASPLAPFIPFIMIGNIIYILCFSLLKKYKNLGIYIGIVLGAFLKFLFLSFSAKKLIHIINLSIPPKVSAKLVIAMGIPQLLTALIGGALALIIIKILAARNFK